MPENQSLQFPTASTSDYAIKVLRAVIGCGTSVLGPVGSLVQSAVDNVIPSPVEARREAWGIEVSSRLEELHNRKQINLDELVKDPQFVSILIEASGIAIKNHSQTKREALRNAVLHSAISPADDESKRRTFMRFVDELSEGHILVLELLQSPQEWFSKRRLQVPQYHLSSSISRLLGDAFPELMKQRDFCRFIITELHNRRLANIEADNIDVMMSASGALQKYTTVFGDQFLAFISDAGT